MKWFLFLPAIVFTLGAGLIVAGVVLQGGQFFLFIIFPGVLTTSPLALVGFLLIFASFVAGFFSLAWSGMGLFENQGVRTVEPPGSPGAGRAGKRERKLGGIILLGPIPIVFGSDRRIALAMVILALLLTAFLFALFFLQR